MFDSRVLAPRFHRFDVHFIMTRTLAIDCQIRLFSNHNSLIKYLVCGLVVANHGVVVHVNLDCKAFNKDIKSQTAYIRDFQENNVNSMDLTLLYKECCNNSSLGLNTIVDCVNIHRWYFF
jgi:hypothetical protein